MAVTGFEVGKYYKWTGSKTDLDNWVEPMNGMLDGKPRKALSVDQYMVVFDGIQGHSYFCGWYWGHVLDRITEVKKGDGWKTVVSTLGINLSGKTEILIDHLPEPKKPIKERRRDIRKRFLGL